MHHLLASSFSMLWTRFLDTNLVNACTHSINSINAGELQEEVVSSPATVTTPFPVPDADEPSSKENDSLTGKRISEKRLKREYINMKTEEYYKRQKRHEERLAIEKEKLELDKKKIELVERYLNSQII